MSPRPTGSTRHERPAGRNRGPSRPGPALLRVRVGLLALSLPVLLAANVEATDDAPRATGSQAEGGSRSDAGSHGGDPRLPALSRGVDSILDQVRKREVELVLREQAVAERERAVVELEQRIDQRARELDRIRAEVEDRIHAWASQGGDRVAQLAKVYSEMPEAKAGSLLGRLDLDLAVSIIRQMKKKASAGVLAAMGSDRALVVSERLLRPLDPTTDAPASAQP